MRKLSLFHCNTETSILITEISERAFPACEQICSDHSTTIINQVSGSASVYTKRTSILLSEKYVYRILSVLSIIVIPLPRTCILRMTPLLILKNISAEPLSSPRPNPPPSNPLTATTPFPGRIATDIAWITSTLQVI